MVKTQKRPTNTKKSTTRAKKSVVKKTPAAVPAKPQVMKQRIAAFLGRRPHRSFQKTRRRDYVRSLKLPGYIAFTAFVFREIMKQRITFLLLAFLYAVLSAIFIGMASQSYFVELRDVLQQAGGDAFSGAWGQVGKAGILLISAMNGNLVTNLSELQQFYVVLLFLFLWLTTVWLLRAGLAGSKVRLRDALYSSGAPIVPTLILTVLFLIQLLPAAFAVMAYSAAASTGFLQGGVETMIFAIVAGLLVTLSTYLVVSTFMSMIIITLPGMYPWRALVASGDLVTGRRVRLLLRLLWLLGFLFIVWCVIMIPTIILSTWLQTTFQTIAWLPIAPVMILILSSATTIYGASYVYLLYRKVVEHDAQSA